MKNIKQYTYEKLIGETLHFKCDCVIPIDVIGTVKSVKVAGTDVILYIEKDDKIFPITTNHPNLKVEKI